MCSGGGPGRGMSEVKTSVLVESNSGQEVGPTAVLDEEQANTGVDDRPPARILKPLPKGTWRKRKKEINGEKRSSPSTESEGAAMVSDPTTTARTAVLGGPGEDRSKSRGEKKEEEKGAGRHDMLSGVGQHGIAETNVGHARARGGTSSAAVASRACAADAGETSHAGELSEAASSLHPHPHHFLQEEEHGQQQHQAAAHRKEVDETDSRRNQEGAREGALHAVRRGDGLGAPDVSQWRTTSEKWSATASPLTALSLDLQESPLTPKASAAVMISSPFPE